MTAFHALVLIASVAAFAYQPQPRASPTSRGVHASRTRPRARCSSSCVIFAAPGAEDSLALGGDVACLYIYAFTQRAFDAVSLVALQQQQNPDAMDAFRNPAFAGTCLALAWFTAASTQDAFSFQSSRSGVERALGVVCRGGAGALMLVVLSLVGRSTALGVDVNVADLGFAFGLLPILAAWRYVLAESVGAGR